MSTLRVLHVVPHLDRIGGYERQARALARAQRTRLGLDSWLLTHRDGNLPRSERTEAGMVHRLDRGLQRFHPGRWWNAHASGIDVVHAHALHKLSGQVVELARKAGKPAVVKVATTEDVEVFSDPAAWEQRIAEQDDEGGGTGMRGWLGGPAGLLGGGMRWRSTIRTAWSRLQHCSTFLAVNADIEAALQARGMPCVRLPNGVDTAHFLPATPTQRRHAREDLGLSAEAFVVVFVGRLARRKDVACLIDAASALCQGSLFVARPRTQLAVVIVGDGPQRQAWQQRARDAGVGEIVQFTGALPEPLGALHAADVLVNPSRREGLPNAVLEAMATGLPTVLSDVPGHTELLAPHDADTEPAALRFDAGDPRALAAVLETLMLQPGWRRATATAARRTAVHHYALDGIARRTLELYRSLGVRRHDPAPDSSVIEMRPKSEAF